MIVFTNPIDIQKLRMAFNNDIVRFYSNSGNEPAYCDITDSPQTFSARLYPDPQGRFFFNFKPYIAALMASKRFEDTVVTNLVSQVPESFVYNYMYSVFTQRNISFSITFSNSSTQPDTSGYVLSWLGGVAQISNKTTFRVNDLLLLSPLQKNSGNSYYFKYWQGYPFDVPFYSPAQSLTVKNDTVGIAQTFNTVGFGDRLFLSDGRTDETLEDLLPLAEGYNNLRFMKAPTETQYDKFLTLHKVPYSCGVYLKWLNAMGGYSYWLFENTYTIDRSTKQLGDIEYDNFNTEDAYTRTLQLGKESQDSIKVIAELLTEDERTIVEGLLDSPKIYLFTGKPYSQNNNHDWMEVSLKTSSARLKNAKQPLTNFTFDLELPMRYTQTL